MSAAEDRALPNARMRHVLLAVQDIMGRNGLTAVLKSSELDRFVGTLPPENDALEIRATELGRLIAAIETQYGRGARGQLTRIGYSAFQHLLSADRFGWGVLKLFLHVSPIGERRRAALTRLARYISAPNSGVRVKIEEGQLLFEDSLSDEGAGRGNVSEDSSLSIGILQACIEWATGEALDVVQVKHKARGDSTSSFEIGDPR